MSRQPLDVLVVHIPIDSTEEVLTALFDAGAGEVGEYRECAFITTGRGRFRPVGSATPAVGQVGEATHVTEDRAEITFPRPLRADVVAALREAHPYEEPSFHVLENAAD